MNEKPLLTVENALKTFTVRRRSLRRIQMTAVDNVSITVHRGQSVGLVGESGSGKSTLGRCILQLMTLDAGVINFNGQEIQDLSPREFKPLRRELQMVFQNPMTSFNPTMTIGQALLDAMRLVTDLSLHEKKDRVLQLLKQVQLHERFAGLYPHEVSGGQLQRAAIARALAPNPEFIFLDEPTAALDMSIKGQIVNLLRELQHDSNLGLVFVSHDLRVVRYVADYVYVMYLGQIVEHGTSDQIFYSPQHPYTRALLASMQIGRQKQAEERLLKGEAVHHGTRGCKLFGRCHFALDQCGHEPQILTEVEAEHWVRCWRTEDIAQLQQNPVTTQP